jgi:hypothetical protein
MAQTELVERPPSETFDYHVLSELSLEDLPSTSSILIKRMSVEEPTQKSESKDDPRLYTINELADSSYQSD